MRMCSTLALISCNAALGQEGRGRGERFVCGERRGGGGGEIRIYVEKESCGH